MPDTPNNNNDTARAASIDDGLDDAAPAKATESSASSSSVSGHTQVDISGVSQKATADGGSAAGGADTEAANKQANQRKQQELKENLKKMNIELAKKMGEISGEVAAKNKLKKDSPELKEATAKIVQMKAQAAKLDEQIKTTEQKLDGGVDSNMRSFAENSSAADTTHYTFRAGADLGEVRNNVNGEHKNGLEALEKQGYGALLKADIQEILDADKDGNPEDLDRLTAAISGKEKNDPEFKAARIQVKSNLQKAARDAAGLLMNKPGAGHRDNAHRALMDAGKEHGVRARSGPRPSARAAEPKSRSADSGGGDSRKQENDAEQQASRGNEHSGGGGGGEPTDEGGLAQDATAAKRHEETHDGPSSMR